MAYARSGVAKQGISYNDPVGGTQSTIDGDGSNSSQIRLNYFYRKALIESKKEMYFSQLASTINMPKNYGKEIIRYHYIPILDDRNINDQGIDAAGATIDPGSGNLYGSSRDIGTITSKLPALTEQGGRVNRVGFTRITRTGKISRFGYFADWTDESMDFDSDSELYSHISREMLKASTEITEAQLQADLLNSSALRIFPGTATTIDEVTGEGKTPNLVDYDMLYRLDAALTANRCPRDTKIIKGSRMIDTKVIPACRIMFIGPELVPVFRKMVDPFNNPAFIPVQKYADAGTLLHGEIGSVGNFRIIEVPEMQYFAGKGAAVTSNKGFRETGSKYDVFPCLVVGNDSFNTIGFETSGKENKFRIYTKKPGEAMADHSNPYGTKGFMSIQWYYGFLCNRPEWIGTLYSVAPI